MSGFETIVRLIEQNADDVILKDQLKMTAIDSVKIGSYAFSAVSFFASKNNQHAVNRLLALGASINYAARGAALGGHRQYAEELIGRGAYIDWVAGGAALGGHREYVEESIRRGADINTVALGAAQGGHLEYVEELLGRGADINLVARGAAQGGHLQNDEQKLRFLAFFDTRVIDKLVSELSKSNGPANIQDTLLKRAKKMSQLMREHSLDFEQALVKAERAHLGTMDILYRLRIKDEVSINAAQSFPVLNADVWYKILSYNTGLTENQLIGTGVLLGANPCGPSESVAGPSSPQPESCS